MSSTLNTLANNGGFAKFVAHDKEWINEVTAFSLEEAKNDYMANFKELPDTILGITKDDPPVYIAKVLFKFTPSSIVE